MDFQAAEARLKKDHNKLRSRTRNRNASRTLASSDAQSKAKKAEEYRKKMLERKKTKERMEKKKQSYIQSGFDGVERRLGLVRELNGAGTECIQLEAVSVHGLGDKITLPVSILSTLAERDLLSLNQGRGQPLFFRIGIRNEDYAFPQSDAMRKMMEDYDVSVSPEDMEVEDDGDCDEDDYMSDDDNAKKDPWMKAYLEELSCQYISYTYATVIEFSQDEGFIGLPTGISNALLRTNGPGSIDSKLTVDPSTVSQNKGSEPMDSENDISVENENDIETSEDVGEVLEEKTPGHAAYGSFPVPVPLIEVSLLTHLPLGEKCTLQPTLKAIENGFYNLKNVKLALEQSLIRTRGSLNADDIMHCWFRGKKFDLTVQDVTPADFGAVSCVNCDIEVDIAPPPSQGADDGSGSGSGSTTNKQDATNNPPSKTSTSAGGYRLSDTPLEQKNEHTNESEKVKESALCVFSEREIDLPPEPTDDQKDQTLSVQIKGGGKVCRRKFLLSSPLKQLFDFAISEGFIEDMTIKLVTRFPRRVFQIGEVDESVPLGDLGLSKQEAFVVEK